MFNKFYDQVDCVSAKYQLHTFLLPILKDCLTFMMIILKKEVYDLNLLCIVPHLAIFTCEHSMLYQL